VRARLAPAGVATLEQLKQSKQSSGLEFLQRIWTGELPSAPIGHTPDFVPIEAEAGRMVFQGTPGPQHDNPLGSMHGGDFCTLVDSAVG
jgi:acyl-coenzyme A thioesterase PaaI-like protein